MQTTFGRRSRIATAALQQPAAHTKDDAGSVITGFPFATIAIGLVLTFIFATELKYPILPTGGLSVDPLTSEAFGAVSRKLVYEEGEVWRVLTASLLHGSLGHLIGNLFVLAVVGFFFERSVGPKWFTAIFLVSGVAGAVGSMTWNDPSLTSVGASGAIMGLIGAAIICAMHGKGGERRGRMIRILMVIAIPVLWPSSSETPNVDYGAHFLGFVAGVIVGLVLLWVWPDADRKPQYANTALAMVIAGLLAYSCAFVTVALAFPGYLAKAPHFAPPGTFADKTLSLKQYENLSALYPDDPRSHVNLGIALLIKGNASAADYQFRFALNQKETDQYMSDVFKQRVTGLLSVALLSERRESEAKSVAKPVCQSRDRRNRKIQKFLEDHNLCAIQRK